ncbi:hypothetical protein [Flagellimonas flava]|uniref:hypothetical protein n=1 Tax=Flagellimonas flava TaxID=570519 RepID=UPI003D653DB8
MIKKICFLVFLNLSLLATSQSTYFNITETPGYQDTNKASAVKAVHTTSDGEIAIASVGKKKLMFDVYDDKANRVFNQFTLLEKKESVVDHIAHDNLLKVFTIYKPTKTEREIRCRILDVENKTLEQVELFKAVVEKKQALFSGQNKRQTHFAVSPNGNYFAIATDNVKKTANSYNVRVYDSHNMELVYTKAFFENPEKFFKSFDMTLSDEGSVFTVGKEYKDGRAERQGENPNYDIVLHKISEENSISSRIGLDSNQHIDDLKIVNKTSHLDLYGFYSETRAGRITGLSKITVDKENIDKADIKLSKLPESVLTDLYSAKRAEVKKDKDLAQYLLDYVIEDDEGNTTLLAEQFYVTQTYVSNGQYGGYMMTVLHYDNILVLRLDNNGDVQWGRSIFKVASAPSYNAFMVKDKLHVMFNTGKVKTKTDGRVKAKTGIFQKTALYDYVYSIDGEVVQEKIRDNSGINDIYHPYNGSYQDEKFIMLNASNENKKVMLLEAK